MWSKDKGNLGTCADQIIPSYLFIYIWQRFITSETCRYFITDVPDVDLLFVTKAMNQSRLNSVVGVLQLSCSSIPL